MRRVQHTRIEYWIRGPPGAQRPSINSCAKWEGFLLSTIAFLLGTALIGGGSLVTAFGLHEVGHLLRNRFGLSD
jgi:hypothetical protein